MGQAKIRGEFARRKAKAEGLLDLALAITGTEVDMELVQITTPEAFSKLTQVLQEGTVRFMNLHQGRPMTEDVFETRAYVQDDGRLVIHAVIPDNVKRIVEIPNGEWKLHTPESMSTTMQKVQQKNDKNPEIEQYLIEKISSSLNSAAVERKSKNESRERLNRQLSQAILVFDRLPNSLLALQDIACKKSEVKEPSDNWLATNHEFLILSLGPTPEKNWSATCVNASDLYDRIRWTAIEVGREVKTVMLYPQHLSQSDVKIATQAVWESLGGQVA